MDLAFQRFGASLVSAPLIAGFGQHLNKMPSPAGRRSGLSALSGRNRFLWLGKAQAKLKQNLMVRRPRVGGRGKKEKGRRQPAFSENLAI
jgi:hypothetical protein